MSNWINKNIVSEITNAMKDMLSVREGDVFQKPNFVILLDTLFGNLKISHKLDEQLTFKLFEQSVKYSFSKDGLTNADLIIKKFDDLAITNSTNKSKYSLVTSIELDINLPSNRKINGCFISFHEKIPKKFITQIKKYMSTNSISEFKKREHVIAVVTVEAANCNTAIDLAFSALDILRCLWHIQFKKTFNILGQDNDSKYWSRSLAKIGRYHSLHNSRGTIENNYFLETKNYLSFESTRVSNIQNFNNATSKYLNKIRKNKFNNFIEDALTSYISAVDTVELDSRFMKLSSTLELLTISDNSKDIIKRSTFLYQNSNIEKLILENLRKSRNQHAHVGILPPNIELKCFQLSSYIENLLHFFIFNPLNAENEHEIIDFLSSTKDMALINSKIKRLMLVKKHFGSQ